ncbi:MAG: pyridoxamine 5'-phosphate oxidase family protein [Gammaproteobacteria bacterium]|nr:pyridoxamine 5'-phosphate oxidase family protein [Gammaproteobacteria bacterium]
MPVFHPGERQIQARIGVEDAAEKVSRMFSDGLFPGVATFIERQALLYVASIDPLGNVWASVAGGNPGFIHVQDDNTLHITLDSHKLNTDDPLWSNIVSNSRVGLLLIDLHSRKRLRINGHATFSSAANECVQINIERVYPNCPRYIQRRQSSADWMTMTPSPPRSGTRLPDDLVELLSSADTLFVASAHPSAGADMSHRGGHPGFIHILDERTLRIPDYPGNNLFNTLGNFIENPRAGLLIPDFPSGRLVQIIGTPTLEWDMHYPKQFTGGTARYWRLEILHWRIYQMPSRLDWKFIGYSPHLPSHD